MGHLNEKVDRLTNYIFKTYCVGDHRFVNKKIICQELTKSIMNYLVDRYRENTSDYLQTLVLNNQILVKQLETPLLILKPNTQYRIDLATNNLSHDINNFFTLHHKMISRNITIVIKKKDKLKMFVEKYKEKDKDIDKDINKNINANIQKAPEPVPTIEISISDNDDDNINDDDIDLCSGIEIVI